MKKDNYKESGAVLILDFWDDNASYDIVQRVLRLADDFRDRPVDFYFAGEPLVALTDVDLDIALRELGARGATVVTCEGGPRLNGDLVAADLVDEWALTVSPLLVGGQGGRSAVGPSPTAPRGFLLERLLEADGLLLGRWVRSDRLS